VIVGVAIKVGDLIYALPRPARHCHLFREHNDAHRASIAKKRAAGEDVPIGWMMCAAFMSWPAAEVRHGEQGFVDEHGNFLDREEAATHIAACDQKRVRRDDGRMYTGPTLYSEDLW
jgi:hypothetical protein